MARTPDWKKEAEKKYKTSGTISMKKLSRDKFMLDTHQRLEDIEKDIQELKAENR